MKKKQQICLKATAGEKGRKKNVRFLVVDDEADEVSVVARPIALPGEFDPGAARAVGLKLQDGTSACGPERKSSIHIRKGTSGARGG